MDGADFDALTRCLGSRRTALAGLVGGILAMFGHSAPEMSAHNLLPGCRKLADPKKRRRCLRRARRHKRRRHTCKSERKVVTCHNRCGVTRNNCRKKVRCTCPPGETCLVNKGCNRTCSELIPVCPPGCTCGAPLAENPSEFDFQCVGGPIIACEQFPVPCVTSANCPRGYFCGALNEACGTNRCMPTCPF